MNCLYSVFSLSSLSLQTKFQIRGNKHWQNLFFKNRISSFLFVLQVCSSELKCVCDRGWTGEDCSSMFPVMAKPPASVSGRRIISTSPPITPVPASLSTSHFPSCHISGLLYIPVPRQPSPSSHPALSPSLLSLLSLHFTKHTSSFSLFLLLFSHLFFCFWC